MEQVTPASQLSYDQERAIRQSELLFDDDRRAQRLAVIEREKRQRNLQILKDLFIQPAGEGAIKRVQGMHLAPFNDHLQRMYEKVQAFDPQLGMDCFAGMYYQSPQTKAVVESHSPREKAEFRDITRTHRQGLRTVVNDLVAETSHFTLERGLLAIPSYESQTGGDIGTRECFNACFRMVFNSLTDLDTTQDEVRIALNSSVGIGPIDDEEYLKVFADPRFQEMSGRKCRVVSLIGTDLGVLDKTVRAVKQRQPDANVYSIVSLLSEGVLAGDLNTVWHTGVLLYADDDHVIMHDPNERIGRRGRNFPKKDFLQRWGSTFNRAHLVIAV